MAYKEIVTKAVIGKGKKKYKNSYQVTVENTPSTLRIIINSSRNDVKLKSASRCKCLLSKDGACDKEGDVLECPELSVVVYQCF